MKIKIKKVTRTKDILGLFFHNDIHAGFVPDKSISKNKFKMFYMNHGKDNYLFYKIFCDSMVAGLCVLFKLANNCVMAHIGILKKFRGKTALLIANDLKNMIFSKLKYKTIIAPIKKTNSLAIRFVKKLGFSYKFDFNDQLIWEVSTHG